MTTRFPHVLRATHLEPTGPALVNRIVPVPMFAERQLAPYPGTRWHATVDPAHLPVGMRPAMRRTPYDVRTVPATAEGEGG